MVRTPAAMRVRATVAAILATVIVATLAAPETMAVPVLVTAAIVGMLVPATLIAVDGESG